MSFRKIAGFAQVAFVVVFGMLALGARPAVAGPYMSSGQWTSNPGIPYSQCMSRAGQALASVGLSWGQDGHFFKGSDAYTTAGLFCYDLGSRFVLTVIVSAQAGGTGLTTEVVRDRIAAVIFGTGGSPQGNTGGNTGGNSGGNTGVAVGGNSWSANATAYRGQNGRRYQYTCSPGGIPTQIWGTDVYTDDSPVCSAAVHVGRIGPVTGGTFVIEIRGGQPSFRGSTRFGVTSSDYGEWAGSYVFVY